MNKIIFLQIDNSKTNLTTLYITLTNYVYEIP